MFCPRCGRQNPDERRFCAGCGTNLETVSKALSEHTEGYWSRLDSDIDRKIARYAERVFKSAPSKAAEGTLSRSWLILTQGIATLFVDLILLSLVCAAIPLRFLMLCVGTPFRLLSEMGGRKRNATAELDQAARRDLPPAPPENSLPLPVGSPTEHTTKHLPGARR